MMSLPSKKVTRSDSRSKSKGTNLKDNQPTVRNHDASEILSQEINLASAQSGSLSINEDPRDSDSQSNETKADDIDTKSQSDNEDLDSDPLSNVLLRLDCLEEANRMKDLHIKLLYGKIAMLESESKAQTELQNDLTVRSMNHNIVLSGANECLKENRGEDCKQITINVLDNFVKMQHGKVSVVRAHRLGFSENPNKPRPIVARLGAREHVAEVMKRCGLLAGTDIFINPQYPQTVDERRSFIQAYRKASKSNGATAKVSVDRLYVNNELRRDLLPPKIPAQVPPVLDDLPPVSIAQMKSNESCSMQLILAGSKSTDDVGKCLDAVLLRSTSTPDNIVFAYRHSLGNEVRRNYESGKDPGTGTMLLKMMDNKDLRDKVAILYIWHRRNGKAKGSTFKALVQESLDELT